MGTGEAEGTNRAVEAATNAISSPLLEDISIDGATGIIINVTGSAGLTAFEVNEATTLIMEAAHEDPEIIFGTVVDDTMEEKVKVTVIATGLGNEDGARDYSRPGQQPFSNMESTTVSELTRVETNNERPAEARMTTVTETVTETVSENEPATFTM